MLGSLLETSVGAVRRVSSVALHDRVRRTHAERLLLHVLLLVGVGIVVFPVFVAAIASTKATGTITGVADLVPGGYAARNYWTALVGFGFWRFLLNSLVMSVVVTAGQLILAVLAALAVVYYRIPYDDLVFLFVLFTLLLPIPVRFVPLYDLVVALGWADTMLAITVPYLAGAAAVFVLRQRFRTIPASLVETARLDGVGPLRFLTAVLLPMSRDVLVALAVIVFVYAWNQYLWPVVIINRESQQVAQVGLSSLGGTPTTMAGVVLTLLPPLLLVLLFHRPLLAAFAGSGP